MCLSMETSHAQRISSICFLITYIVAHWRHSIFIIELITKVAKHVHFLNLVIMIRGFLEPFLTLDELSSDFDDQLQPSGRNRIFTILVICACNGF